MELVEPLLLLLLLLLLFLLYMLLLLMMWMVLLWRRLYVLHLLQRQPRRRIAHARRPLELGRRAHRLEPPRRRLPAGHVLQLPLLLRPVAAARVLPAPPAPQKAPHQAEGDGAHGHDDRRRDDGRVDHGWTLGARAARRRRPLRRRRLHAGRGRRCCCCCRCCCGCRRQS